MPRSDDGNDDEVFERHTGKKDCGCKECVKKRVWENVKDRIGKDN